MRELKFKNQKYNNVLLFKGLKPIVVKVNKKISNLDIATLNKICLDEFFQEREEKIDLDRYDLFINTKVIFDTYIITNCTNLKFKSNDDLENMLNSKFFDKVIKRISNYERVWDLIMQSITLKNNFVSLNLIKDIIPNGTKIEESVKETAKLIEELNKKNPELLKKIIDKSNLDEQIKVAKEEYKKKN